MLSVNVCTTINLNSLIIIITQDNPSPFFFDASTIELEDNMDLKNTVKSI